MANEHEFVDVVEKGPKLRTLKLNAGFAQLQKWRVASINRRIFMAMVTVGIFTFVAKAAALAKDLFVAPRFGVSSELDAYLVSLIIPSLVMSVVSSSFDASLIPVYVDVKANQGHEAARNLLRLASGRLLIILSVCTLILGVAGSFFLSFVTGGFDDATFQLTLLLYFIALPCIVVSGMGTIWASILNAEDQFVLPAVAPAIVPLAMVIGIIVAPPSAGVLALSISMSIGYIIESALVGRSLQKRGLSLLPRFRGTNPDVKRVMGQMTPVIMGGVFSNSAALVDQSMAALLGAGSVSILGYGSKLNSFAGGIAAVAIGSAMLPYFSRLVANKDWQGVRRTFRLFGILVFVVAALVMGAVILLSEPIIRIVFERGAFTPEDTIIVSHVQSLSVLQMPFFALSMIAVRVVSSLKGNRILAQAAVINGVVNIVLNYVLMQTYGVAGIALSSSLTIAIVCGFFLFSLRRLINQREREDKASAPS